MTPAATTTWHEANQVDLLAHLERVRRCLERLTAGPAGPSGGPHEPSSPDPVGPTEPFGHTNGSPPHDPGDGRPFVGSGEPPPAEPWAEGAPLAVDHLVDAFDLSPFERDVVLLCAGVELDARFSAASRATAAGGRGPTFSLALAALGSAHWDALAPGAPLRHWQLVTVAPAEPLVTAPLRIDERILHHLLGLPGADQRLAGLGRPWPVPAALPGSHRAIADDIVRRWQVDRAWTPLQLEGPADAGVEDVAAAACAAEGLRCFVVPAAELLASGLDPDTLVRLWDREAALEPRVALLVVDPDDGPDVHAWVARWLARTGSAVLVAGPDRLRTARRALPRLEVARPDRSEQLALWRRSLGPLAEACQGQLRRVTDQFDLGPATIGQVAGTVWARTAGDRAAAPGALWEACRSTCRADLDDLAPRQRSTAGWEDLVLPPGPMATLHHIVTHVRHRSEVYDDWGFAGRSARGLGISALFHGTSGTGKTLAAEVLANELDLDLYRIDLSQVVSKYIGETEKNLRRVFDAAESAGAVLLFDEADALFGRRSEVKDSHDRYANIEVSYLLQRMEAYRGLAILTTNMKTALDPAFARRLRFIVGFPFPDAEQRTRIWERVFPPETPTEGLDPARLARLDVAGGNIRNIALGAAFLAADEGRPVAMAHVLRAARAECAKIERPLTEREVAGWV